MRTRNVTAAGASPRPASALRKRLTSLEQLVQGQQHEIERLHALLATGAATQPTIALPAEPAAHTTRRGLLKLGGAVAAAGVAAAATTLVERPQAAHAADGAGIIMGTANTNASSTGTILTPVAASSPIPLLTVDNSTNAAADPTTVIAIKGIGTGTGAGVLGHVASNGVGVDGSAGADGIGVVGFAPGALGYGVLGFTNTGWGVVAQSGSGVDLVANGTGRFGQAFQAFTGAPTTGSWLGGEQIRDAVGDLYLCVNGGTPGIWRRVVTGGPTFGSFKGGALNLLAAPVRLLDTRPSSGAPITNGGHPLTSGQTFTVQVTGITVGGIGVPAGAVAVLGNITVTNVQGGGDLRFYPSGTGAPFVSSINYSATTVANFAVVGLGSDGALVIHVDGAGTDAIFDIAGFVG
ncbi:MAG TPA: hypothetical protein VID73_06690 [Ktedonobacterales bacterium]|jgi:hypothetical protein